MLLSSAARGPALEETYLLPAARSETATTTRNWYGWLMLPAKRPTRMRYNSARHEAYKLPSAAALATEGNDLLAAMSEFGRTLVALRAQIIESGEAPLTWEELEREIAERRGEVE